MVFFDILRNSMNSILGRKQEFEELLAARDIDAVRSQMTTRSEYAIAAMKEYNTNTHSVMLREDKILTDKKGNMRKKVKVAKLPIPYQKYINEIALVFLYGRPVKWSQLSDGTDAAFEKFQDVIKRTRFDSKIRECKRIAGIETESAMLFRVFKDDKSLMCKFVCLQEAKAMKSSRASTNTKILSVSLGGIVSGKSRIKSLNTSTSSRPKSYTDARTVRSVGKSKKNRTSSGRYQSSTFSKKKNGTV